MERVRLQNGNHNKGIVIDAQTVVLGSHNRTGDGTTLNRDASLVFNDPDIARYYVRLFEYDWNRVGHAGDAMQDAMPRVAQPGEPTPGGMTRVGWRELFPE
jgi:phosphatidylserine/phosphatidylglycerophosphate/cardiolipin synthase-like enzyme